MEGPLTSNPKEKKKHFILEEIDMHLEHLKEEERHSLCNGFWFFAMIFTVLAGVMCILIGLSQTVIFQQYPRNWELFGAGCGCCSMFFVWLCYICCPGRRESSRRKEMDNRKAARSLAKVKKEWDIDEIPSTLDENAYKKGIIPFGITEKDKMDGHHDAKGVSKMYLKLGKIVSNDIKLPWELEESEMLKEKQKKNYDTSGNGGGSMA
jgi:hypothetical protein